MALPPGFLADLFYFHRDTSLGVVLQDGYTILRRGRVKRKSEILFKTDGLGV